MPKSIYTVTSGGRVTIPAYIRKKLELRPKDKVVFMITSEGTLVLRPLRPKSSSET